MLSFLDAYQGYNQIPLAPKDQEKASFVKDQGVFCYNVMPFGLKNTGATYQRLVNHMFQNQIGRNMEVYIDDMLVKSEKEQDHIKDLEECFQILATFGMKLNPAKCTFGVRGGRFLGYMISERGIEANPEKINAIMDMSPPKSIREVQKLAGRLAALNRFISRSADKGLPFFKILRGGAKFEWSKNGQEAFDELKKYLVSPPLLTKLETGETLYLYLAVSENAVSSVLVRQENREHLPVYYVSKVLQGAEPKYSQIEKLALSLVIAARKDLRKSSGRKSLSWEEFEARILLANNARDAHEVVKHCRACQERANVNHQPAALMRPFESPCSFDQWGIDLVGPLPQAAGQRKFLIVAVDYFTKWVEAKPLAKISENEEWCKGLAIKQFFTSVSNPQANGQTKVTNRTILHHLKTRLGTAKGAWVDELPSILWAYRTTPRTTTGETPFSLSYGTDTVAPVEVGELNWRVKHYDLEANEQGLRMNLDFVEEVRERASVRAAMYKAKMAKAYNFGVRPRNF
ncbi:Transposon Tf2-12 polyprotein [Sesamum angolense]|uniref:Transposon Tf2-12 polyprotein n=1 Tax=Sesamum angolense TaxID=2727404 RepID=A0AAE1W2C2_9LAMI|nr:Transposon Tf2-12 polyprotein [Sesamum angolense]